MEFLVDKVGLWQVSLTVLRLYPVNVIPLLLHIHSCIIWGTGNGPGSGYGSTETVSPNFNHNKDTWYCLQSWADICQNVDYTERSLCWNVNRTNLQLFSVKRLLLKWNLEYKEYLLILKLQQNLNLNNTDAKGQHCTRSWANSIRLSYIFGPF